MKSNLTATDQTNGQSVSGKLLKGVRRAHLFLGLFMAPWVLLYSVTGFYFHHQAWFHPNEAPRPAAVAIPFALKPGKPPIEWPDPEALARRVVREMNRKTGSTTVVAVVGSAHLDTKVVWPLHWGRATGVASYDGLTGQGSLVRNPRPARTKAPSVSQAFEPAISPNQLDQLRTAVAQGTQLVDPAIQLAGPPRFPDLRFQVERDGQRWNAAYNLTTGAIQMDPTQSPSLINALGQLHRTYGYNPAYSWVRTTWGILTDLVALTLCFWVLTGLAMWYQLKALRWIGSAVLGVAAVLAVLVITGMWKEFGG